MMMLLGRAAREVAPDPKSISAYTNVLGRGVNSTPMNRKWCAPGAAWMAPPRLAPTTILGSSGAAAGVIRVPGGGRVLSGVLVRTMIQPVPVLLGRVNGPV